MTHEENKSLKFLRAIAPKLQMHQYRELKPWLIDYVKNIPIPLVQASRFPTFHPYGSYRQTDFLYRACENTIVTTSTMKFPFDKVSRISHVPLDQPGLISTNGRCNLKGQVMFYCSNHQQVAALECLTKGFTKDDHESKTVTLGTWKINEPLVLAQVMFSEKKMRELRDFQPDKYDEQLAYTKNWYEHLLKNIENDPDRNCSLDYGKEVMEFFSDEFGKINITDEKDYHLSIFFTDFILNQRYATDPRTIDGVMYPSVKFGLTEFNIALHPRAMQKLSFNHASQVWVTNDPDRKQVQFTSLETAFADKAGVINWNVFKR